MTIADGHEQPPASGLRPLDGAQWYTVADVDRMPPFLMSLVSDGDRWMFVSSSGALTAGRGDADHALFPYVTDDRLHASGGRAGPVTRLRVSVDGGEVLWAPFEGRPAPGARRFLSKSVVGDSVLFEEHRADLGVRCAYRWNTSERFGFVRTVTIRNTGTERVRVAVLDGLVDLVPYGLDSTLYQRLSNLANAYKRSELVDPITRLAVYSLESPVSDRPEPEEVLRATVAWSTGLDGPVSLDPAAVARFEDGEFLASPLVTGVPGAYLAHDDFELDAGSERSWEIVADVTQSHDDVVGLRRDLRTGDPGTALVEETHRTGERLGEIMARADAPQVTGDPLACAHHLANVTYNVMRGGVPLDGYRIHVGDLVDFVEKRNRHVAGRHSEFLASLPERIERRELQHRIAAVVDRTGDVHLGRLAEEYLPFSFSRRHGDPSRPWNQFSIRVADDAGAPVVYYEGNWRDLFQNWEALCASCPEYLPGVVTLFVNASTADGYNPYRITRDGIDWEVPDTDDPWSNIGYWGDHQIVYLLRLLEATEQYLPGEISRRLDGAAHTYADVPYRIAAYDDLLRDPKSTIGFDDRAHAATEERVGQLGGDGKLLVDAGGRIVVVTLLEKLLVPALAKLSNFVPGGGIWMNTQRPEWNDANNALVGNGVSMVTLYYLRRFLTFFEGMIAGSGIEQVPVSKELKGMFDDIARVLETHQDLLGGSIDDRVRKKITDALGQAGSDYRIRIYENGFSGEKAGVRLEKISDFVQTALKYLEHSIDANRRPDDLYHAYNLMSMQEDGISISHLDEMLEGQVAVLSSGYLSAEEAARLLDALRGSALYREDQNSYMLYPAKELPRFLEKNNIPESLVKKSRLLQKLVADGNLRVIVRDVNGGYHFNGSFRNAGDVRAALEELRSTGYKELVAEEGKLVLQIFEEVFNHKAFTGRSGTFFAYEGLGSIYWHMVSKLHLAVQEICLDAMERQEQDDAIIHGLVCHFHEIGEGIGIHKSPEEYGAFPTDPYSHTPRHRGAQQPGMTGQVKEDILVSIGELGAFVDQGRLVFSPRLLKKSEFSTAAGVLEFVNVRRESQRIEVPVSALCFSYCQVPVIYRIGDEDKIEVRLFDAGSRQFNGLMLDAETSTRVFQRTGEVKEIVVSLRSVHLV